MEEMTIRAVLDEKYYNETPTVKTYVAVMKSPKHISRVVKSLNEILPVPQLQHLKRVKRNQEKFMVILDYVSEEEEEETLEQPPKKLKIDELTYLEKLKEKGFNFHEFEIVGVEICEVPESGPKTRAQYEQASRYWPVNFHPEKKLETMMSEKMFEESEWKYHIHNMTRLLKIMKEKKKGNVALVVDFECKEDIAMGYERVEEHPLQHAIMVAVDAVASTHKGGAWNLPFSELTFSSAGSKKTRESGRDKILDEGENAPYLCTGYDLYVVREPCVMCAMSLVHSRIKRIFFHSRNPEKGALVSRCQIHAIKDLNHHYEVFEILKTESNKE